MANTKLKVDDRLSRTLARARATRGPASILTAVGLFTTVLPVTDGMHRPGGTHATTAGTHGQ